MFRPLCGKGHTVFEHGLDHTQIIFAMPSESLNQAGMTETEKMLEHDTCKMQDKMYDWAASIRAAPKQYVF